MDEMSNKDCLVWHNDNQHGQANHLPHWPAYKQDTCFNLCCCYQFIAAWMSHFRSSAV